jgi:membrane-associated phospholipid phosphatase
MRFRRTWRPGLLFLAGVAAGCGDSSPTAPAPVINGNPAAIPAVMSLRWNERARDLVAEHRVDPPMASRDYALLSLTQYAAVVSAKRTALGIGRPRRAVSVRAAIMAASADALARSFPGDADFVLDAKAADAEELSASGEPMDEILAGYEVGRQAAYAVSVRTYDDGSLNEWSGTVPTGPGYWFSSQNPATAPLRPTWGSVATWVMQSGDQFRPPPPPAFGSTEFDAALAEVRRISDSRSAEQTRIAAFWADGAGTQTPPGHWNAIAASLIARDNLNEEEATRILTVLNAALIDAGIACWDAKYHYWVIRPSQADPAITTSVPLPNFPSYVSGHSSFSAAAALVLGAAFPKDSASLDAMAHEAALSRLYGGIHYRFDNERGLALGEAIGKLALPLLSGDAAEQKWREVIP